MCQEKAKGKHDASARAGARQGQGPGQGPQPKQGRVIQEKDEGCRGEGEMVRAKHGQRKGRGRGKTKEERKGN